MLGLGEEIPCLIGEQWQAIETDESDIGESADENSLEFVVCSMVSAEGEPSWARDERSETST